MPDFNFVDGFRLFDRSSKGYATQVEVESCLSDLGVPFFEQDVTNVFETYCKKRDGKFRFSDFCDFLTPKFIDYSQELTKTAPLSKGQKLKLSEEVTHKLAVALRLILETERAQELL
jgi:hypothetical protein